MPAQSASLGSGMLLLPLQTWQDAYALAPTELALAVPKGEKAGELAEHLGEVAFVDDERIVDTLPTYRGEGKAWL